MAILLKATSHVRMFMMIESADHITALTGATVTVNISKNGGAFGAAAGAVAEVSSGWYSVTLSTVDTGTAGDLAYHCTATSGDNTDFVDQVADPTVATLGCNLVNIAGSAVSATTAQLGVNVVNWNNTVVATPATAGIPDVNTKNMNNVATTSVTTINANQGMTQPLNFTGTAGSALAKVDVTDIATVAVSATTAQLGVNVVNWNNTVVATPATAGIPDINVKNIVNTAAAVDGNNLLKVDLVDIAGSAVSASTAQLGVNLVNVAGSAVSTSSAQLGVNVVNAAGTAWASGAITSGVFAAGAVNRAALGVDTGLQSVRSNTAQTGTNNTITLDASASATNNYYINDIAYITGGTGVGQARFITGYVGATKVATVDSNWATNPDNTSTFAIIPFDAIPGAVAPTAAQVATAVWEDTTAGGDFGTAGSIGKLLAATTFTVANQVDVNVVDWKGSAAPAMTGDAYARLGAPAGASVSADIAAVKSDTGAIKTSTAGITYTVANQVDTNVVDWKGSAAAAMTGDAYARLGAPAGASVSADVAAIKAEFPSNFSSLSVTSGGLVATTSNIKKDTATNGFMFVMTDSTTHAPKTGLAVSGVVSIDGAAFVSLTNAVTEVGSGTYTVNLAAADVNGNHIMLRFTATAADDLNIEIITQP